MINVMKTCPPVQFDHQYSFRIADTQTATSAQLTISRHELTELRLQAKTTPLSPLLVKKIEAASRKAGYLLLDSQAELFRVAKEIIVDGENQFVLHGRRFDTTLPDQDTAKDEKGPRPEHHGQLILVNYRNPISNLAELKTEIIESGMIPVLWNNAGGFQTTHLSPQFPLLRQAQSSALNDPAHALRFIINQPQNRVCYILEDIHHFIGQKEGISPSIGSIRSLIKEVFRALAHRNERLYFFVPADYVLPPELAGFVTVTACPREKSQALLDQYGVDMTADSYRQRIHPVIGATELIDRIIQTLTQMEGNNPLLIGYPGVGKTALVEGFALALAEGLVPPFLRGRALYLLSLSGLIAGTKYRGDMEARLEGLMAEVLANRDELILFIDEIQGLLDAGMAEGGFGLGDILKPVLARGEFPLIGATTFEGYAHLSKDPALMRRFRPITINEPTEAETLNILRGVRPRLEKHHGLTIDTAMLTVAIKISGHTRPGQHLPGRAIAVLDSTAAYCRMKGKTSISESDMRRELTTM